LQVRHVAAIVDVPGAYSPKALPEIWAARQQDRVEAGNPTTWISTLQVRLLQRVRLRRDALKGKI
jgi:hypothetical protein